MTEEPKKFDALQFLMNKYGRDKFLDRVKQVSVKKAVSGEFWKYPKPGEKAIVKFIIAPEGTRSDNFKFSGGIGFVGTIEDAEGIAWPVGVSEAQIVDLCGEMEVHFKGWTPDFGLKIVETLSFEVETRGWQADIEKDGQKVKDERKKSTFTVLIDEAYNRKQVDFAKQLEEHNSNSGTGVDITADMFEMPAAPTGTPPTAQ
jgi:hypothetical protein